MLTNVVTCALRVPTNAKVLQADMGCMPAILALGRLRQENQKFKACVDYMTIPFPKNKQKKQQGQNCFLILPAPHKAAPPGPALCLFGPCVCLGVVFQIMST